MKIKIKWIARLLLVVMVLNLVGCGNNATTNNILGKKKISLEEYVSVSFEGYNGVGTASLEVNFEGVDSLVEDEKITEYIKSIGNVFVSSSGDVYRFSDIISFELQEDSNLSNGDVVKVVAVISDWFSVSGESFNSMQKGLGIEIKDTVFEFTVDGLEDAKVLDVLGFVDEYIVYEGANGGGEVSVQFPEDFLYEVDGFSFVQDYYINELEIIYNHKSLGTITYHCNPDEDLSKGQSYTITVDDSGLALSDTGYIMISKEKTMAVPDLGEYIKSKDELTEEFEDAFMEAFNEALVAGEKDFTIHDYYWGTLKSTATTDNIDKDSCKIFVIVSYDSWFLGKQYLKYQTYEMIKLPDGTYDISFGYESWYDDENISDEDYDLEKIELE